MKRKFTNTDRNFPEIKRKRLIISLVLGIFNSFVFYLFLCLIREMPYLR